MTKTIKSILEAMAREIETLTIKELAVDEAIAEIEALIEQAKPPFKSIPEDIPEELKARWQGENLGARAYEANLKELLK